MISERIVSNSARMGFLPRMFTPKYFTQGESLVYTLAKYYCEEYDGGYWEYKTLSNGGFLMTLDDREKRVKVINPDNYYEGMMSPDALSIGICIIALNRLMWAAAEQGAMRLGKELQDHWDWLKDYAYEHPERVEIARFID